MAKSKNTQSQGSIGDIQLKFTKEPAEFADLEDAVFEPITEELVLESSPANGFGMKEILQDWD